MLTAGGLIAKMRYNRRLKRLQKGCRETDTCRLVRADQNLAMETINNSCNKQCIDVCILPFAFPRGPQSLRRYFLYNNFYCVFPTENKTSTATPVMQDQILKKYSNWLSRSQSEHALPEELLVALKRENKTFVHPDVAAALNHFYVTHKFICQGYVLSSTDYNEKTTVTLVYHRTQPVPKNGGILIDPNIFCLMDTLGDITTHSQINNEWCGDIAREFSVAQIGVDTNIQSVPTDKTLYATFTCILKSAFYPQTEHVNIYPRVRLHPALVSPRSQSSPPVPSVSPTPLSEER